MEKRVIFCAGFILLLLFAVPHAKAGTSHGVNGYVSDCGSGLVVDNATVLFQLAYYLGTFSAGYNSSDVLNDTVGEYGNSNKSGWYVIDVGNFATQWIIGDIVLINISKSGYGVSTNVSLTNAGNDQAFTVCLGNATNYSCACGNGVCEYWVPLCENDNFTVNGMIAKRCPEDCGNCSCGNHICQWEDCGESMINCPWDCDPGYCGDGICQSPVGETQVICPKDCGYYDESKPNCGNGNCEPDLDEDWIKCPNDCYSLSAHCGDGICNGAETSANCCLDCKCPDSGKCHSVKCIHNKCQKTCCLFGYCCVWLGLCWFWWMLILMAVALLIICMIRKKKRKRDAKKQLAKKKNQIIKVQ